jgi:hypothetical protein
MPTNKNAFCEVKSRKSWQEVSIDGEFSATVRKREKSGFILG